MADDWVARLLAAVEATEWGATDRHHLDCRLAHDTHTVAYAGQAECSCGEPEAVRRRCAADRRRLERHTPIPNHGRFSDDWASGCPNPGDCDCGERPKVCGACRDQVGDPLEAPCPDLLDLADSYGVAPAKETADE